MCSMNRILDVCIRSAPSLLDVLIHTIPSCHGNTLVAAGHSDGTAARVTIYTGA